MSEIEKNPLVEAQPDTTTTDSLGTLQNMEESITPSVQYATKQDIINRAKELLSSPTAIERGEIDKLKQVYYRLHTAEAAAERDVFIANGGEVSSFIPSPDKQEEEFKALMVALREQRAHIAEQQEQERQNNLQRKQAIIERLKDLTTSADKADKAFEEIRDLQTAWKEIGAVPPESTTDLWKNYHLYVEQFYDLLRLNHEMRNYDFKKNLEAKEQLIATAERLTTLPDIVSAFHQLQTLHEEYRAIGPVIKDLRETVWGRFKSASTIINKRYQEHFEQLKAQEQENLQLKTALCEKIEAIDLDELQSMSQWDKQTKVILEAQTEWRNIGFTPRKVNAQIFERFRIACDRFFSRKSTFFKQRREEQSENLRAKQELCERAEALKDSTDWMITTNKFVELQKEWKKIGSVSSKASEAIWKRFQDACNFFFERRSEATSGLREEEAKNLEAKEAIIKELEDLFEKKVEGLRDAVRQAQEKWNTIGHVPFRKKEKIYRQFRTIADNIFDYLREHATQRDLEHFRKEMAEKGGSELSQERQRLQRILQEKKSELQNYETNLGFFHSKSKQGNSLVADIERKMEKLREDLAKLSEKLTLVNKKIKEEQK